MFTGIIEAVGSVAALQRSGDDARLRIASGKLDLSDVQLGDSIAVNGVCLTVVTFDGSGFSADVSAETLACTTTGALAVASRVNIEKALLASDRLGGHLVSGHVDGVGEVVTCSERGESLHLLIRAPAELARYIAAKGSVCVDGVSLTVNAVHGSEFELNIVPHTQRETIIGDYAAGSAVNLEVDLIARYLERLMLGSDAAATPAASPTVDRAFLAEHGFANR
ncbi:MAG: riboflavin synthase [Gammaproteobacteria bacterium]|nr:riboflavin synthase [Gammaproteobacteria bacterium]